MSVPSADVIRQRIDQLLAVTYPPGDQDAIYAAVAEVQYGAMTLADALYGAGSIQVTEIREVADRVRAKPTNVAFNFVREVLPVLQGALRSMRADVDAGLIGRIERRATGEALADMIRLAREALADGAVNVAAVLAAAAYEDTIRRLGATVIGPDQRPSMSTLLDTLKKAGILVGAPLTTAQSYLKFRNDALHADWGKLDIAVVGSCLGFVEGLLVKHFS